MEYRIILHNAPPTKDRGLTDQQFSDLDELIRTIRDKYNIVFSLGDNGEALLSHFDKAQLQLAIKNFIEGMAKIGFEAVEP